MSSSAGRPVLVVDNFDSFVYNLVQYLGQLGVRCIVRRNDAVTAEELPDLDVAEQRGVSLPAYDGPLEMQFADAG